MFFLKACLYILEKQPKQVGFIQLCGIGINVVTINRDDLNLINKIIDKKQVKIVFYIHQCKKHWSELAF